MAHKHPVYDTDKHFVIDTISHRITTECRKVCLPQRSHKSERFTFELPKMVEGHDMELCNVVEIHFQNISSENKEKKSIGIYTVTDLKAEGDTVFCSWLIEDEATAYNGGLAFAVHFACVGDNGDLEYKLPTLSYSGITIGETVWNSETIAREYPDVIAALEARVDAMEKGNVSDERIAEAVNTYMAENPVDGMTEEQKAQLQANTEAIAKIQSPVVYGTLAVEHQKYTITMGLADGRTDIVILETDANDYPTKITHNGREIPWTVTGV